MKAEPLLEIPAALRGRPEAPAVLEILGEIHRGHPALPQLALDALSSSQRRSEPFDRSVHRARSWSNQFSTMFRDRPVGSP